jgi:hypothetical protein
MSVLGVMNLYPLGVFSKNVPAVWVDFTSADSGMLTHWAASVRSGPSGCW